VIDALVAVIVAVVAGGVILFPSLGLLFRLLLRGRLDHAGAEAASSLRQTPRSMRVPC
jgi:cytochrome d ubiquinol oxidase subunit II